MELRRVREAGREVVQVAGGQGWVALPDLLARLSPQDSELARRWATDIVAFLGAPASAGSDAIELLPFEPRSYRDFMLFERHGVGAARGFVRMFWPCQSPFLRLYEAVTRRIFPPLLPALRSYRQPIYNMGNHLAFAIGQSISLS